ncbi:MAG: TolC family protein [Aquificaceae bacterium]
MLKTVALVLTLLSVAKSGEITLQNALRSALEKNESVKALEHQKRAAELRAESAKRLSLPRVRLEENISYGNLPSFFLFSKLNQGNISALDFSPDNLKEPDPRTNFETKVTVEVPIWMGGKTQALEKASKHELGANLLEIERKTQQILKETYQAYINAASAKQAIKVAEQGLKLAQEHLKLSENLHKAGVALLSDVLFAKTELFKAQENLQRAKRDYALANRALFSLTGLEGEVLNLQECENLQSERLRRSVLERQDIKALRERSRALKELYRSEISEVLPQLSGFIQLSNSSKDAPLANGKSSYTLGLNLSILFEPGQATLLRSRALLEEKKSTELMVQSLSKQALLELERAISEYENALDKLSLARQRVEASEEAMRVLELRYKNGLGRIVDLLEAKTQLDRARLEEVLAIRDCHIAFSNALFSAGIMREVLK